jgi:uncharacterized protein YkwD
MPCRPARLPFLFVISVAALAACQPGGRMDARVDAQIDALMGETPYTAPAEQALTNMCLGDSALTQRLADAVNAARAGQGKTTLVANEKLNQIAQSHACDMATHAQAMVAGTNGSNVVDRARSVKYPTCGLAQLVAVGGTPEATVRSWLGSVPHRTELLGQTSAELGTGAMQGADGRIYWSVVQGAAC